MSGTLYEKLWDSRVVADLGDGEALRYIDRQLVDEVRSPQAFRSLLDAGRRLHTTTYGAFFATSLASTLTALGVDSVLLTWLTTSGCVRATCVDAMSHGFRTAVIAEACGDRHPRPHQANLFDMNAKYADVVSEGAGLEFLATPRVNRTGA